MIATSPLVVLLHGLGRTPASMWLLARRLSRAGYQVIRLGYRSTRQQLSASIAELRGQLADLPSGPIHLVGHSLGGLIAVHLLRDPQGLDIKRVVQIGSPNLGSPLAERLGGVWPIRRICGPVLSELSRVTARKTPSPQIGAIAGTMGLPWIGLAKPHDGAVTLRSAWSGAGYRAAVSNLHTVLPISPGVARLTIRFLTQGDFGGKR
ncbi:MAG: alpha/beta fold hydrolase [Pseudomonadota bacterium]